MSSLDNVILISDRVLIKPLTEDEKTSSGLILPPGYHEKEIVAYGYIVKVGPGYPLPSESFEDEYWKRETSEQVRYLPLQVKEGDIAVYLQKQAIDVEINNEEYKIVNQNSILLVQREDFL